MFKTRLDTFGNTFGHFWNFENIFLKIFENSTLHGTLGKKSFRKICPKTRSKHAWILSGTILGIFGILKKKILKLFENSTLHGTLGINSFRKNHPKTRLDSFGKTFGHFWKFEKNFFENFRKLDPPWNTGHKIFQKICPKTRSKHAWILSGTILGIFGILKKKIFENFRKLDPPWNTGHKIFSKKSP